MTIPFKNIPQNLRVPLFYAEVDNSQANTGQINQRSLIVAQMLGSGTATPGIPVISQGAIADKAAFGQGSVAALMVAAYRGNDNFGELWVLPLADDGAATAATGSVSFTGPAAATGVVSLYIAGVLVSQAVTTGQTATQIATNLVATINGINDLSVTAATSGFTVLLTAKNRGPNGNEIDLRVNYQGAAGGEAVPAGVGISLSAMTGGATAPSLTTPFLNLGDQPFDFIAFPYTDTNSLDALKGLLGDITGRWSWAKQIYGGGFAATRGTLGALTTFGTARNDQHVSVMGFNDSPSPAWIWAAALTGAAANSLRVDPALPLQTLPIAGVRAPPLQSRFVLSDRNVLLWDGVSTFTVDPGGTVRIENLITTYQQNAYGQPDNSYLEIETLFTLAYVLRRMRSAITSKYSRMKLASDNTRFAAGSGIVTPKIIKAELIAEYRQMESEGYVQNGDTFKTGLIVQQNATNPNRVDVLWPGILIDQLRIFAVLAQFRLV